MNTNVIESVTKLLFSLFFLFCFCKGIVYALILRYMVGLSFRENIKCTELLIMRKIRVINKCYYNKYK